jgi:SNF family Na+-dependent transporter
MGTLGPDLRPTRLVGKNVGYSFCIAFGIKWTGRITYFIMGLPAILLFVFLGRALLLPGSEDGVEAYIHDSNWEVLPQRPEVWSKAVR